MVEMDCVDLVLRRLLIFDSSGGRERVIRVPFSMVFSCVNGLFFSLKGGKKVWRRGKEWKGKGGKWWRGEMEGQEAGVRIFPSCCHIYISLLP
jgi:hypothetical protein